MTKQEEIREGLWTNIIAPDCDFRQTEECPFENNDHCIKCVNDLNNLLSYLDSQGVVIEIGYSVEPLIKEE